jgi:hypothetical protein
MRLGSLVFVFAVPAVLLDSGEHFPTIALSPTKDRMVTAQPAGPLALPSFCDRDANVYLRMANVENLQGPIIKLNRDGKDRVEIQLPRTSSLQNTTMMPAWTVRGDGRVFVSAFQANPEGRKLLILEYDAKGDFSRWTELHAAIFPTSFVVLEDGRFLVHGRASWDNDEGRTATLLINTSGQVERALSIQEAPTNETTPRGFSGELQISDEKSVWFVQRSPEVRISLIDGNGDITKRLKLRPPVNDAQAYDVFLSQQRIMVAYAVPDVDVSGKKYRATFWALYNLLDAKLLTVYRTPRYMGGAPVCFEPRQMTFLTGSEDGYFALFNLDLP